MVDPTAGRPGTVHTGLVEAIDLLPTFKDVLGLEVSSPWLDGRSLVPALRGTGEPVREAVFSELDYAFYGARRTLGIGVNDARATMVRTVRWKYVRFEGFPPQLFDLEADPDELHDLGRDPGSQALRATMEEHISRWRSRCRSRTAMSDAEVAARGDRTKVGGVRIGEW